MLKNEYCIGNIDLSDNYYIKQKQPLELVLVYITLYIIYIHYIEFNESHSISF